MRYLATVLASFFLITSPAFATDLRLRCIPVKEAGGKGMKLLLQAFLKKKLESLTFTDVSVQIKSFKQEKNSADSKIVSLEGYTESIEWSNQNNGTAEKPYTLAGQPGEFLDTALFCKVPLKKIVAVWSGTHVLNGKTTAYKKMPLELKDITLPGLLLP